MGDKMKKRWLVIGGVTTVLLITVVSLWLSFTKPNTKLNDVNVSLKTKKNLELIIDEQAEHNYQIAIDDQNININASELGLHVDKDKTVKQLLKGPGNHHLQLNIDEKQFDKKMEELEEEYNISETEPSITFDEESQAFNINKGSNGKTIDRDTFETMLLENYANNSKAVIDMPFTTVTPSITETESNLVLEKANSMINSTISLKGLSNLKIDKNLLKEWVEVNDDLEIVTNDLLVKDWINQVQEGLSNPLQDGIRRVSSNGDVIRVELDGSDGYAVKVDELFKELIISINNAEETEIEIPYEVTKAKWTDRVVVEGAENFVYPALPGEKWININLSNHEVTAYEGLTPVLSSPMISAATEYPNAVGEFSVYSKLPLQTMRGNNADGTRYETENVPWILYYHGGYALHGAYWRTSFGYNAGSNGSHGCINLPVNTAKALYDWADEGTKVVSHY